MRILTGMAVALFVTTQSGFANAVEMKDCNDLNSTRDRTECLQSNLVLLNAAFQVVTRELRDAVRKSSDLEVLFRKEIDDLRSEVRAIKPPTNDEIKAVVSAELNSSLTGVKIDWAAHPSVCLFFNDWTSKPERTTYSVEGCGSDDGFKFNIHK